MKRLKILSLALVSAMSTLFASCNSKSAYQKYCEEHPLYEGSEEEFNEDMRTGNYGRLKSYETFYNIIFAASTVPPVLSALMSILNGYETYAMVERGKTYSGINETSFHNIGFDPSKNLNRTFNQEEFDKTVNTVKELNKYGHEHFLFYAVDSYALEMPAIASNALLKPKQYHMYMMEDGTGSYIDGLYNNFIKDRKVTDTIDEPYEAFKVELDFARRELDTVLSKTDNKPTDITLQIDWALPWALATFPNFHYVLQDFKAVEHAFSLTIKRSLLAGVYGLGEPMSEKADVIYNSISDYVSHLNNEQKQLYLKLMYGQYFDETINTFTRKTTIDGIPVPNKKMVSIPGVFNNLPHIASDITFGIGGLSTTDIVPNSYNELPNKYKLPFLFDKKEDYDVFLNSIHNPDYYPDSPSEKQKQEAKALLFNFYIDYMFSLKMGYAKYGYKYDLILKGHPSEDIAYPDQWSRKYKTSNNYVFNKLLSGAILDFHKYNTVGKMFGRIPYGTAAENLAYIGADIALGGMYSSTYTGYDPNVPVEFVFRAQVDGSIEDDNTLSARYHADNLFYYDDEGERQITRYINKGKFFELMRDKFEPNSQWYSAYNELRTKWLQNKTHETDISKYIIDNQGFVIKIN